MMRTNRILLYTSITCSITLILICAVPCVSQDIISVSAFLPSDFTKDGSESYQTEIQAGLNALAGRRCIITFPPMVYLIDEKGLELYSNMTLRMDGAVFRLKGDCQKDGQAFKGHNLQNVSLTGGEIEGALGIWPEGVNVRGIYFSGRSNNLRISNMYIHDITSNAIGIFGSDSVYAADIRVSDVIAENGCNYYGDYLSERPGPEAGSMREDQGLIAFYYVENFTVRGCRFEKSRSDGTHFYKCKQGQFVSNKVYLSQMGGYFLEGCDHVTASDNIIRHNGSRGCTIERGSKNCLLQGNVITQSGREGLWAPNSAGLIISGNIFDYNGQKPNGTKSNQIWSANITINTAHDPSKTFTRDYLITDNIFYTADTQIAAVRIEASAAKGIIIKNNYFHGGVERVLVQGEGDGSIYVSENHHD